MENSTQAILIGLLGVLFHCFIKLNSLTADARVANVSFSPVKDYLLKDIFAIGMSLISVSAWYFVFPEVANAYPALGSFVKVSFFVMGAMGSWVIQLILGRAKKQIRAIVDAKTTALDGTATAGTPLSKSAAREISENEG